MSYEDFKRDFHQEEQVTINKVITSIKKTLTKPRVKASDYFNKKIALENARIDLLSERSYRTLRNLGYARKNIAARSWWDFREESPDYYGIYEDETDEYKEQQHSHNG